MGCGSCSGCDDGDGGVCGVGIILAVGAGVGN